MDKNKTAKTVPQTEAQRLETIRRLLNHSDLKTTEKYLGIDKTTRQ